MKEPRAPVSPSVWSYLGTLQGAPGDGFGGPPPHLEVFISQCGCIPKFCRVRCGALPPAGGGAPGL